MLGTIVNTCTILTGSFVGSFLSRGISEKYKTALFDALGLATVGLGANAVVHNLPNSEYPVLFIASLAIGTIIGTRLDICGRFNALLAHCKGGGKLAEGLSTAILLFCIGTLSILGPIESRLNGNNTYLFTNATLDLVSSMIFASTYGFGIAIAAAVLFCWQGSIYLFAGVIAPYLTPGMMTEISLLGGIFLLEQRRGHFAAARLQNLKYAAFAFGAAAVVYYCKFFTVILTEKYIIMLHCVDELAGNVYN